MVGINDEGLHALGQYSANLQQLYLDYGTAEAGLISGSAMGALARGCTRLQTLSLRGSKQVDNNTLAGLPARGCPSLLHLDLHACTAVGDAGLHFVVAACQSVRNPHQGLRDSGASRSGHGRCGLHTTMDGSLHLFIFSSC